MDTFGTSRRSPEPCNRLPVKTRSHLAHTCSFCNTFRSQRIRPRRNPIPRSCFPNTADHIPPHKRVSSTLQPMHNRFRQRVNVIPPGVPMAPSFFFITCFAERQIFTDVTSIIPVGRTTTSPVQCAVVPPGESRELVYKRTEG